jgi:N-methylhydantoinase A
MWLVLPVSLTVAVDIGGTFTDLIGYDDGTGRLVSAKSSTTPADLARAIQDCFEKIQLAPRSIETFVHGSTVAINTVVERKGAKTALVVTRGTRDVYAIGRGNRPDAYDVWFKRPVPLVPRHLTFEIDERLGADGSVRIPFDVAQAEAVAGRVAASGADAVAVCLLHSWSNPAHEQRMAALLETAGPGAYVTMSNDILREYGEYERMSTTVLNAYIGPRIRTYLDELERRLGADGFAGDLLIMQSNGGVMAPSVARTLPVATLESGPVGGFMAAARVGVQLGYSNVIAFDMGGTTAKTNVVRDGEPQMAHGYHIGGYATGHPMTLPVVDTVEVGAGGGSIACADAGGLRVGPQSAGAEPGPACYGKGGTEPTVTDANVVLGRIDPRAFLGGEMTLDADAARAAVRARVATPLGLSDEAAALAIVKIAVLHMSLAVRQVSVERGYDPRDFAMLAFGGAGPLHAVEVARALHIPTIVVPLFPGQFSAAGMLMADLRHDYVRTYYKGLERADFSELTAIAGELAASARQRLREESASEARTELRVSLDVRYAGQDGSMPVPVDGLLVPGGWDQGAEAVKTAFNDMHQRAFGYHDAEQGLEVVSVRLAAVARRSDVGWSFQASGATMGRSPRAFARHGSADAFALQDVARRTVWFEAEDAPIECPVYQRDQLAAGEELTGPAVVQEYASTTLLSPGDRLRVAETGELVIHLKDA